MKKLMVVLIAAFTALALLPAVAFAEGDVQYVAQIGDTGYKSVLEAAQEAQAGDTIMMLANSIETSPVAISSGTADHPVTLDLNGFTLTGPGTFGVIIVNSSCYLNLTSSSGTGKITQPANATGPNDGGGVYVYDKGCLTMYNNVVIENCKARNNAGGVYVYDKGSFTMKGGSITGCTAAKNGGGVLVGSGATFTMTGGRITGCTATNKGGGVFVREDGHFDVSGAATVTGNTAIVEGNSMANNVFLERDRTDSPGALVNLAGNFTGNIGITQTYGAEDNVQFGINEDSAYTGAENFFYDTDDTLIGTVNANDATKLVWATACTVTFNLNGQDAATPVPDEQKVPSGATVTEPSPAPAVDGYRLDGWYTETACTNAWNFENDTVKGDTTLYAKWLTEVDPPKAATGLTYNGNEQTGVPEDANAHYTLRGTLKATDAGKYKAKATPAAGYCWSDNGTTGEREIEWSIGGASIADAKVSAIGKQEYTGEEITPIPTVTVDGVKLMKGTDFELAYEDNVDPGEATVTITGKGNYAGSTLAHFTIVKKAEPAPAHNIPNTGDNPLALVLCLLAAAAGICMLLLRRRIRN